MKLYLDPGHGGADNGASGKGLHEKNITLAIAKHIRHILQKDYQNVAVKMSRSTDKTVSLTQRTNEANHWGADFFLSIHCNSFNGKGKGYEDYIHSSLASTSKTAKYQNILHKAVLKQNQLSDRGRKKDNFHVLRESTMPAVLSENGFIDNTHDSHLMKQDGWRKHVAQGHVNGLAKIFHLKKKPSHSTHTSHSTLYKVIAGSFKKKRHAENLVKALKKKKIASFIDPVTISGQKWFRVQAGAYKNMKNAEQQLRHLHKAGINDAFITKTDK